MRPYTTTTPKPLLPLERDGSSMLDYSIKTLTRQNFVDIFINYSYGLSLFESLVKKYKQNANIHLLDDRSVIGQGGIILGNLPVFDKFDCLLCLNGDTFVNVDFKALVDSSELDKCLFLSDPSIKKAKPYLLLDKTDRLIGYESPSRGDYYFYSGVSEDDLLKKANYLGVTLIPTGFLKSMVLDTDFMGLFGRDDLFERLSVRGSWAYPTEDANTKNFLSMDTCEEYERILENNDCSRPVLHTKIE